MPSFSGRTTYEIVKANILRDLSLRKREIDLSSYGERALKEAVHDDPRLIASIAAVEVRRSAFSSKAFVQYSYDAIDLAETEYAKSKEQAESILLYYLTRFYPKICLVLPIGLTPEKVIKEFSDRYSVLFPAFRTFSYTYSEMPYFGYCQLQVEFQYAISRYKLNQMEKKLSGEILSICNKIFLPDMPPLVKAYVAHNYLARTVTYWKEAPTTQEDLVVRHSAYGAIFKKRCVCQGFSEAFLRLMDAQGIECYVLHGKVYSDLSAPHAWNLVCLSPTEAFHVDATWDAMPAAARDTYFGVSDKDFASLREWDKTFARPAKSGTNWIREARRLIHSDLSRYLRAGIDRKYLIL